MIDKVKKILIEELNLESIEDGAQQADYPEWDSLNYLRVVSVIEKEFGVEITPENINRFNSVSNIVEEVKKANDHR